MRVKDSRVLKKYVLRRFPMMLRMREEMFMEKVGRYEIDSGEDIPDIYEKYYTTAKYAYNQSTFSHAKHTSVICFLCITLGMRRILILPDTGYPVIFLTYLHTVQLTGTIK